MCFGAGIVIALLMESSAEMAASASTARTMWTTLRRGPELSRFPPIPPPLLSICVSLLQICLDRNPHAFKPKVGPNKSVSPWQLVVNCLFLSHYTVGRCEEACERYNVQLLLSV